MTNQNRIEMLAFILEVTGNGNTKTKIMYKACLSHTQLKEFFQILEQHGLMEKQKDSRFYKVTEKGKSFLHNYRRMNVMNQLKDDYNSETFLSILLPSLST